MKPTVLLFISLLWAGSCDKADEPGYMPGPDAVFMSIAHLKSLCTKASVTLTRDIRLRCVVTANDHYGEFDRTLVVADASGGIEVAVDAADLYRDYPLGANLTLYCNGLALGDYGGKIQLGAPPRGDYAVDRIPARELSRYLRCNDSGTLQRDFVRRSISEISLRDVDTYVRFRHRPAERQEAHHGAHHRRLHGGHLPCPHARQRPIRRRASAQGQRLAVRNCRLFQR